VRIRSRPVQPSKQCTRPENRDPTWPRSEQRGKEEEAKNKKNEISAGTGGGELSKEKKKKAIGTENKQGRLLRTISKKLSKGKDRGPKGQKKRRGEGFFLRRKKKKKKKKKKERKRKRRGRVN